MSSGSLSAAGVAAAFSSTADDGHHELVLAVADVNAISIQDRKDQTLLALKSELIAKLDKEVKSLDDDSWMFEGPRSRVNLISRPGGAQLSLKCIDVKLLISGRNDTERAGGLRHGHTKLSASHEMALQK